MALSKTEDFCNGVIICAVAGSGKTSTLVKHYLKLIEKNIHPSNILIMTFTNKAAEELRKRILENLSEKDKISAEIEESRFIGTIHSFCYYIIEKYGFTIGIPPIKEIISVFEWSTMFSMSYKEWLDQKTLETFSKHYKSDEIRKLAMEYVTKYELIELWKNESQLGHENFFELIEEKMKPLMEKIREKCLKNGNYTFNWLEFYAYQILSQKNTVLRELNEQIMHVLIDEFQDTSKIQWEIIKTLINGKLEKLFIVGDSCQSIYSFRNADVSTFFEAQKIIKENNGKAISLKENFRTSPKLLSEINLIGEKIFKDTDTPFTPMKSGINFFASNLEFLFYDSTEPDSEIISIAQKVKLLLNNGVQPKDISLLFRVSDRITKFYDYFFEHGIPVNCLKTGKFQENYVIADIITYLKFIENPLSDFYLVGFLRSSFINMEIEEIKSLSENSPLFYALINSNRFSWLTDIIKNGKYNVRECLKELFINTNGLKIAYQDSVFEFLSQLITLNCDVTEAISLINDWMKDDLSFGIEVPMTENSVSLSTVHAAKGLEFDHVFLVDNMRQTSKHSPFLRVNKYGIGFKYRVNGIIEKSNNYQKLEEIEKINQENESRRLLYVAITRCKKSLTISLPKNCKVVPNTWASLFCAIRDSNPGPAD